MSGRPEPTAVAGDLPLETALARISTISDDLVEAYETIARRAERVERELERKTEELARRCVELDRVKGHVEAILRSLPTGVVVRDEAGRIARLNGAALDLFERCGGALAATTPEEIEAARGAGGSVRTIQASGVSRVVLCSRVSTVRSADGVALGSVEILDDRTEVAALSERLHALDKLAALGTMAAGIAHEIRNPLNAVQGFAALLLRGPSDGARTRRFAERIVEGSREADEIIHNLLHFASPENLVLEEVEPGALIASAVDAAFGEAPRDAWTVDVRCTAPPFEADRVKLRQAVRNLVANARQVQPDGGAIAIRAAREVDEIRISVSDAGAGVPDELRTRLVDPFFTTRAEGTGLGLALTHAFAQLHGGRLEIAPEPSELGGARFTLHVPYSDPQRTSPCRSKASSSSTTTPSRASS